MGGDGTLMEQRTYHGKITPEELAQALTARFSGDDLSATVAGEEGRLLVSISSSGWQGGRTALQVGLSAVVSGGVLVTVGEHDVLGVASDLLQTGLAAMVNPLTVIGEMNDVARNVERLQLPKLVWETVDHYASSVGAGLTPDPVVVTCPYCGVDSPIGVTKCSSCGASLASAQPLTCAKCGKILPATLKYCTRCGAPLAPGTAPAKPAERRQSAEFEAPTRPPMTARFGQ